MEYNLAILMYWKFSNIILLLLLIPTALLCSANLQVISWWVFTKEVPYLWKSSRQKVIKLVGLFCKMHVAYHENIGRFSIMGQVFRYLSKNVFCFWICCKKKLIFSTKLLGVVVSIQVWYSWGSEIKPGHGQVLLEWEINFKIANKCTSDLLC